MKYYAMFSDHSGLDGVPVFFEARMFEEPIQGNAFDKKNSTFYPWMKSGFPEDKLKGKFYLYTKNLDLNFDYYQLYNNFIISDSFLKIIDEYHIPYSKHEIEIFDAQDNTILPVVKKYFFVKFEYSENVVDFDRSIYKRLLANGEPIFHNGVHYIEEYKKIELVKENIKDEVFLIKDVRLGFNLFCTEEFKNRALEQGVYGVMFVQLDDFIDFSKYKGFLGKENYERLKNQDNPAPQGADPSSVNAAVQQPKVYTTSYKELSSEETQEVSRLIGIAEELLIQEISGEDTVLNKLAEYINLIKEQNLGSADLAYQLGSLFGKLIVEQYGWEWIRITVDGESSTCVCAPDKRFACKVYNYMYALITTEKTNNLKLLFNMMENLDTQKTVSEVTFLN